MEKSKISDIGSKISQTLLKQQLDMTYIRAWFGFSSSEKGKTDMENKLKNLLNSFLGSLDSFTHLPRCFFALKPKQKHFKIPDIFENH